jgi:hypothetical protein
MGSQEWRFRCREAAFIALEAIEFASRRAGWRPRRLAGQLRADSTALAEARRALRHGDMTAAHSALRTHFTQRTSRFPIDPRQAGPIAEAVRTEFPSAARDAVARGERLIAGRHDLLGYADLSFGEGKTDWHLDPVHRRRAPSGFWRRVPFLDPGSGDHKIIWELNRHQHWLALGRAAWLTGEPRYRETFVAELRSWREANPPLTGVNWASMLELAFRSLSWVWALHFFVADERHAGDTWLVELLEALDRQLEHVARHLSVYFSPNTHLLGEALALYVAGKALPEMASASRWAALGRGLLLEGTRAQVNADGGHAELSTHYHRYALDFYLLALAVARRTNDPAGEKFTEVASRMATYCRAMADDTGRLPTIGDDDGGLLLPICGRAPADASDTLSLAASLLGRPELAVGDPPEEVLWMLGGDRSALARPERPARVPSQRFPETGYIVMRSGPTHAILDAGPHGFLNGGHAHADALSLLLTVDNQPLLIDPGTATYTMDATVRDRFRSTAMHNTVVVDGRSQSAPKGPFHWRTRADARVELWRASAAFDYAEASHDGYAPLAHRRAVLALRDGLFLVIDHLLGQGRHDVEAFWHLSPDVKGSVYSGPPDRWFASTADERRHFHGDHEGLGWCSPVYGQLVASHTLRCSQTVEAPGSMATAILATPASTPLDLRLLPAHSAVDDGWHHVGLLLTIADSRLIALFSTPVSGRRGLIDPANAADRPGHLTSIGPHSVTVDDGELMTDARVAVLRLSGSDPASLILVEGRSAGWSGGAPFNVDSSERAEDLHLDLAAQCRLSRDAEAHQRQG